jgi:hypothetical protein
MYNIYLHDHDPYNLNTKGPDARWLMSTLDAKRGTQIYLAAFSECAM